LVSTTTKLIEIWSLVNGKSSYIQQEINKKVSPRPFASLTQGAEFAKKKQK